MSAGPVPDAVTLMPESRDDFTAAARWGAPSPRYRVHVTVPPRIRSTDPEFFLGLVDEHGVGLFPALRWERPRRKPREFDSFPEAQQEFNRLLSKHPGCRVWMVPVLPGGGAR